MTAWTNLSPAGFDPTKPITQLQGLGLRNNILAQAEGSANAPKHETESIEDGAITNVKIKPPVAGDDYLIFPLQKAEHYTNDDDYPSVNHHRAYSSVRHLGVICLVAGSIRCKLEHKCEKIGSPGVGSSFVRIVKNGVEVIEWENDTDTWTERTQDIDIDVGDIIIFQQKAYDTLNVGAVSYWRYLYIYSQNKNFAVA